MLHCTSTIASYQTILCVSIQDCDTRKLHTAYCEPHYRFFCGYLAVVSVLMTLQNTIVRKSENYLPDKLENANVSRVWLNLFKLNVTLGRDIRWLHREIDGISIVIKTKTN